jgi:hypothetical protein
MKIDVNNIQKAVSRHFYLRLDDMKSNKRMARIARPRQLAMYLACEHSGRSLPDIGFRFGGRDHTTVLHATSRILELLPTDADLAWDYYLIHALLARLARRKSKIVGPPETIDIGWDKNKDAEFQKKLKIRAERERVRNRRRHERAERLAEERAKVRLVLPAGFGPERLMQSRGVGISQAHWGR